MLLTSVKLARRNALANTTRATSPDALPSRRAALIVASANMKASFNSLGVCAGSMRESACSIAAVSTVGANTSVGLCDANTMPTRSRISLCANIVRTSSITRTSSLSLPPRNALEAPLSITTITSRRACPPPTLVPKIGTAMASPAASNIKQRKVSTIQCSN